MINHTTVHAEMNKDGNPVFSTGLFHYDPAEREFVTEASTLSANLPSFQSTRMLVLKSKRTGADKHFTYVRSEYTQDEDHELLAIHYLDVTTGLKVAVLND